MLRRIGFMIVVLFAAITINFFIPRLMPGDVTNYLISSDAPPEVADAILKRLGLDRPMWEQFVIYVKNTFTGTWGYSFRAGTDPVSGLILARLPRTLALLIPAEIIAVSIGYFLGVTAGWKAGSRKDYFITGGGLILWAMPMFWTAMILLYVGGYLLNWFPIRGYRTVGVEMSFFSMVWDRIWHMILPVLVLVSKFGAAELVMRNTMTITLKQNYVTTARAKGLSEMRVKHRHAARNALIPLVTSTALRMASMAAGLIFIETVFTYPGMGKLVFDSVIFGDYPVLQACFLMFAIIIVATIFLLDLFYARLDPRVRYE